MTHPHEMKTKFERIFTGIFKVFFGIIFMLLFALLIGYVVMLLWNWLMPMIFGLGTLSFWEAVGLLILAKLFFGGLGSGDFGRRSKKKVKSRVRQRLADKEFSCWKHYDEFWKEEGKEAYETYLRKREGGQESEEAPQSS